MSVSVEAITRSGRVEGEQRGGHVAFRGIPFAKPPVGQLRFRAPEAPESWSGVRAALQFGPSAPQGTASAPGMNAEGPQSEDCLYLNVYTKAADRGRRPVLFWIHGGAFTLGSASQPIYDGGALAERGDVVVVTTNYRLGVLGYLYLGAHPELGASANPGQLDQIAALRWVRDNIENFGGDPENVTVFGESAGSMAATTLMAMPAAKDLFRRVIAQSGSAYTVNRTASALQLTEAVLERLGAKHAEALRTASVEQLIEAQAVAARSSTDSVLAFRPTLDPESLPLHPGEALAAGKAANVPLVIGTNRDEMNLFTIALLRELDKPLDDERAAAVLQRSLPDGSAERASTLLAVYRKSREAHGLPSSNRALLSAIQGDLRFRIPSVRLAEANRRHNPSTFMYLFTYESPAMRGALRSCHALEIPFVFGTLDAPFQDRFAGTGPAVSALSEHMMDSWLTFARRDQPGHPQLGDWIPYDTSRRATMVFDTTSTLQDAPLDEERAAWDGVL